MDAKVDKERSMLEILYAQIISDMKSGFPLWEDFLSKGSKLQIALKTTLTCLNTFLDSFQKVADMASGTRGSTKEIGSALTRLCLRQRSVESKTKQLTNSLMEALINPMSEKLEEWKRQLSCMEREHGKESKRVHQELKKSLTEAQKDVKKIKKSL
ncbi:hypothetical protein HELRODRAFT_64851 [Helobdella robusta]|uniref:IMD domain-containing protein n=1 Tax=Helobdella robusta TaxID=6412 RepID=T1FY02_HELRO|nr:hypothetical protein HELRODRAFT_64851 [Helobdella robusta]ESO06274.1 hypothetical protein HELRODRAFT_64851 [Helobdella robusta]